MLIFGFGMTCEDWEELGYVAALADRFRIVCVEPRGHGRSACPTDPADYALAAMASDVEAVIAALGLSRPILWGYSLGAKIAVAAAGRQPAAYEGLVLGGFEPHSEVNPPNDPVTRTLELGPAAWRDLWAQMLDVPPGMSARLESVNAEALLALRQAEGTWPTLAPALARIDLPALVYAADGCFFRDATAAAARELPQARYLERAGRNHFDLMTDSRWITAQVVQAFCTEP